MVLLSSAGPVVKMAILILLLMSVISWGIIFSKIFVIRGATRRSARFLERYHASENFGTLFSSTRNISGPIAEIFRAGYKEVVKTRKTKKPPNVYNNPQSGSPEEFSSELEVVDLVERALKKAMTTEISKLENSLTFLATTGNTAPFIGLFGTVWGIMTSFIGLAGSQGVPSLQVVAPGIAEALIATAIGLAAAIPAVVGYNYFISQVRKIDLEMENFSAEFLNVVERYINR
ncbi:MAG: protein TolQ [Candidatus Dadabacteria bacterium]|nr:protein TolQ [Candidatus Dadabacteria bacterium]NIQ14061.1 protein TolQ [Candidatus Dadabacteria bacterium]